MATIGLLTALYRVSTKRGDGPKVDMSLGGAIEVRTFGDTILMTIGNSTLPIPADIEAAAAWSSFLVATGLDSGYRFRGAIAAGDFISTPEAIIGPAVADAAAWYERADWIGVHVTPSTDPRIEVSESDAARSLLVP